MTLINGSETPRDVTFDYSNLTQYATSSDSTIRADKDGHSGGTLKSVEINRNLVLFIKLKWNVSKIS